MDAQKLCTPDAQAPQGSPQLRPQEYPGSPQGNPPRWCDAFHSSQRQNRFRCRTVDRGVEKRAFAVHNVRHPVGERWTTPNLPTRTPFLSTDCGFALPTFPHGVELGTRPLRRLACGDDSGQLRCPQGVDGRSGTVLWRNGSALEPNRTAGVGAVTRSAPGGGSRGATRVLRGGCGWLSVASGGCWCGLAGACGPCPGDGRLCPPVRLLVRLSAAAQLLMRLVSSVTWL